MDEDLEAGRVAGELEEPEDPDDGEELEDVRVLDITGKQTNHIFQ